MSSDSEDLSIVKSFLSRKKFPYVREVKTNPLSGKVVIYVSFDITSKEYKNNTASNRQISYLKRRIFKDLEIDIETIKIEGANHQDLEDSFLTIIHQDFPHSVESISITGERDRQTIIIETGNFPIDKKIEIERKVKELINLSSLKPENILWVSPEKTKPTKAFILKKIKILQPISLDDLNVEINLHELFYCDPKWLNSMLDNLRKKKFITRSKNAGYSLTALGIEIVPAGTSRTSSDIERALAISKKKW
uniref:hypothetical protein n=1 Tax=Marinobacterium profundum TaxID=1714300 RepID=UPI0008314EC8|nr:hypothetical protein [Marinobacterium profundum]